MRELFQLSAGSTGCRTGGGAGGTSPPACRGQCKAAGLGLRRRADEDALSEADEKLLAALYALRKRLAAKQKLPAYMVFNDSTLRQMALKKPLSVEELLNIPGVGEKKAARYGQEFLGVIEDMVSSR